MSTQNEYDPNAVYKEKHFSTSELDSSEVRSNLRGDVCGGLIDYSKPLGVKNITNEEIKEIAEQCSTPMDSLSSDQRDAIMEYQIRMGVGQARSQGKTSTRSYHYFK